MTEKEQKAQVFTEVEKLIWEQGLKLVEPNDHTVMLLDSEGKQVAIWSSSGATVAEIVIETMANKIDKNDFQLKKRRRR